MAPASTDTEFKQTGAYFGLLSSVGVEDDRDNQRKSCRDYYRDQVLPSLVIARQADESQSQPWFQGLGNMRTSMWFQVCSQRNKLHKSRMHFGGEVRRNLQWLLMCYGP